MIPLIPSCPPATWCATTPTVHFSEVVFFQSASLRRSNTPFASCTFASYCFASASALPAMGVLLGESGVAACVRHPDDNAALKGGTLTAAGRSTILSHIVGAHRRNPPARS